MTPTQERETVNIRPGVAILSVLRHLNYRPWFAMAEFVDNSLQSFLDYREQLMRRDGPGTRLKVAIELDPLDGGRIVIRDNAAGIHAADYARAFRPAQLPPDQSGLCEFGMGMKSAACWFAEKWTVRTSALGEPIERTVSFDIDAIIQDSTEELQVRHQPVPPGTHYTEITLTGLNNPPQTRTIGKIKDHLASIYRKFIREGILELTFDGVSLQYDEPKILVAPYFRRLQEAPRLWSKEIHFELGRGLTVHGFAALRERASTSSAGFALFRRGRLIQGSSDEAYRPEAIFGASTTYPYQRIFGELELEGFEVSHTKDGFRWDENEEPFLELLREELDSEPLPLLAQANGHRATRKPEEWSTGAQAAVRRTAEVMRQELPPVLEKQIAEAPVAGAPPESLPVATTASRREIDVELHGKLWRIVLELTPDPSVGDWVSLSDEPLPEGRASGNLHRCISVRLALTHPFMERFCSTSDRDIEPLLRVAAAIGLAETAARDGGVRLAGTIRRNINELLRDALSKP